VSSLLWRGWVNVRAWIVRVSGEAENPGPEPPIVLANAAVHDPAIPWARARVRKTRKRRTPWGWRKRNVNDLKMGFLNAHSLGDDKFRKYLLAQYRRKFDILAIAETWCPDAKHETQWAKDWKGSGGTIWASGPPQPEGSSSRKHWGRGMCLLFASGLGDVASTATVLTRDPGGRYLAVQCLLHGRESVIICAHADNDSDEEQEKFYRRLHQNLPSRKNDVDYLFLLDANNAPNWHLDRRAPPGPTPSPTQNRVLGIAAMRTLLDAYDVADTFRHLHPRTQSFTRDHTDNGRLVSQKRIDRIYASRGMLRAHSLPTVTQAAHLWPEEIDFSALRQLGSTSKWSDHATVSCNLRYTDVRRAENRWSMPLHVLDELQQVEAMRGMAEAAQGAKEGQPLERLLKLMDSSRQHVQQQVKQNTKAHRRRKQKLVGQMRRINRFLGTHGEGDVETIDDKTERERRRAQTTEQRALVDAELLALRQEELTRWYRDRSYQEYRQEGTCSRTFFEDVKNTRVYSHIEKLRGPNGETYTKMPDMLTEARRHFGAKGALFNLQRECGAEEERCQRILMDALRADRRAIPETLKELLSVEAIFTPWNVQYAIEEMASTKMAGEDGIPADWFRVVGARVKEKNEEGNFEDRPSPLAKLMTGAFKQVHRDRRTPEAMRNAIVSLIYKEKGYRYNLKYYRPIAVANAVSKILEKTMVLSLRPLLDYVVSPEQKAFQQRKYIAENTQLVQDVIAYCDDVKQDGMLIFCDQDSAYPRVEWKFMALTMRTMGFHEDFIELVDIMYKDSTLQIKVNGHVGESFHPTNAVAQGSPLSPLLYLLVIQSFVSLLSTSAQLEATHGELGVIQGISVPGQGGDEAHPQRLSALAFADDIVCFLRDERELPAFSQLLNIYERGAGAVNSWEKTHGMRVGTLRESEQLPEGWVEGQNINTRDAAVRYLGIFLGCKERVARAWEEKVSAQMRQRYDRWISRGAPATRRGRNLVIRNHVNAVAWYMVQGQTPPHLTDMMEHWRTSGWRFFEMALQDGGMTKRGRAAIERHTLIQDYAESGMRCQDVELFVKSLYMRQVGRLVAPSTHRGIDLVMAWINRAYGHLRMGKRLLISSCDWLKLPEETPQYWRYALKSMGALRGLVPRDSEPDGQRGFTPEVTYREARHGRRRTVRVGGEWSVGRVLMEPLFYNPHLSGWWGACVLDSTTEELEHRIQRPKIRWARQSAARVAEAEEVYARSRKFAGYGITHVCHLLNGTLKIMTWGELKGIHGRRGGGGVPCERADFEALIASLPKVWREVINTTSASRRQGETIRDIIRRSSLPKGSYVCAPQGGCKYVTGIETETKTVYEWLASGALRPVERGGVTAAEVLTRVDGWSEVAVWKDGGQSAASVRQEEWGEDSRRGHQELGKPKALTSLVCAGKVVNERLLDRDATWEAGWHLGANPSHWAVQYAITDRVRNAVHLEKLAVKHLYAIQLSRLFRPMRTFDLARAHTRMSDDVSMGAHTTWVDLLQETENEKRVREQERDDVCNISRIMRRRRKLNHQGWEYLVMWEGHEKPGEWTWECHARIRNTVAMQEYTEQEDESEDGEREQMCEWEVPVARAEQAMRYQIFSGLQDQDVPLAASDTVYGILADAEPVGERRCRKEGITRGKCDLCYWMLGTQTVETARHIAIMCPCNLLAQEAVLRAALQCSIVDDSEQARMETLNWRQLMKEQARLVVTGYRHCASGRLTAEERVGHKPLRVLMAVTMHAIVNRRRHNAHAEHLSARVDWIYEQTRGQLNAIAQWTRRIARDQETHLRILHPKWQPKEGEGPMAEWTKEWVASGLFAETPRGLRCWLPESVREVKGAAVNQGVVRVMTRAMVRCESDSGVRIELQLTVGATPPLMLVTNAPPRAAPDWTAYCDGAYRNETAGWGWSVTVGGDGRRDTEASEIARGCGPVVVDGAHPAYLGATKHSNNTGELSAAAELLHALLYDTAQPPENRGVIRPDSELAMGAMTGRSAAHENAELARCVRGLWERLRERHGGRVTLSHVKGHSQHIWNDRADALAERGRQGEIISQRNKWETATGWLEQPSLVSTEGRFTMESTRTFWVKHGATHVELGMTVMVDTESLRWTRARQYPRISVASSWDDQARELICQQAHQQEAARSWVIGTSTVAMLFHPSVTEENRARVGACRVADRAAGRTVTHRLDCMTSARTLMEAAWEAQRACRIQAIALSAAWCRPEDVRDTAEDDEGTGGDSQHGNSDGTDRDSGPGDSGSEGGSDKGDGGDEGGGGGYGEYGSSVGDGGGGGSGGSGREGGASVNNSASGSRRDGGASVSSSDTGEGDIEVTAGYRLDSTGTCEQEETPRIAERQRRWDTVCRCQARAEREASRKEDDGCGVFEDMTTRSRLAIEQTHLALVEWEVAVVVDDLLEGTELRSRTENNGQTHEQHQQPTQQHGQRHSSQQQDQLQHHAQQQQSATCNSSNTGASSTTNNNSSTHTASSSSNSEATSKANSSSGSGRSNMKAHAPQADDTSPCTEKCIPVHKEGNSGKHLPFLATSNWGPWPVGEAGTVDKPPTPCLEECSPSPAATRGNSPPWYKRVNGFEKGKNGSWEELWTWIRRPNPALTRPHALRPAPPPPRGGGNPRWGATHPIRPGSGSPAARSHGRDPVQTPPPGRANKKSGT
jgi:ribonuclease HI